MRFKARSPGCWHPQDGTGSSEARIAPAPFRTLRSFVANRRKYVPRGVVDCEKLNKFNRPAQTSANAVPTCLREKGHPWLTLSQVVRLCSRLSFDKLRMASEVEP